MKIELEVELVKLTKESKLIEDMALSRAIWHRAENDVMFKIVGIINVGNRKELIKENGGVFITDDEFLNMQNPYDFY